MLQAIKTTVVSKFNLNETLYGWHQWRRDCIRYDMNTIVRVSGYAPEYLQIVNRRYRLLAKKYDYHNACCKEYLNTNNA